MENTLENKAKFFALYWGFEFTGSDHYGEYMPGTWSEFPKYVDKQYLILKPISSISDEDAEYCIGKVECSMRKNDPSHGDYGMSPSGIFVNSIIVYSSYHIGRREADYLRSKGYALKWMDKTVKEQIADGWIKLKED